MIRGAFRLAIVYFVAWLLTTQWAGANVFVRSVVDYGLTLYGDVSLPGVLTVFLCLSALVHLLLLPLWFNWVPVRRSSGPVRHPFPARPLRIHLRFRRTGFLTAFFLEIATLLWALRALEGAVGSAPVGGLSWLVGRETYEIWGMYAAAHALILGFGWLGLWLSARVAASQTDAGYGFAQYHVEARPMIRMLTRVIVFGVFPVAAFSATSHPHPAHWIVVGTWLVGLLAVAEIAQAITLAVERRHDRWLADLGESERLTGAPSYLREQTLRFLHPDREVFPSANLAGSGAADSTAWRPAEPRPAVATGYESPATPAASVLNGGSESGGESVSPSAEAIDEARALIAAGAPNRAHVSLSRAIAEGNDEERAEAEALVQALPGRRLGYRIAGAAVLGVFVAVAVTVGWQWFSLPSADETRRLARSAHIHVSKTTKDGEADVALLGTRYDFSLNTALANVSPNFLHAVISSEDHRFYTHGVTYKVTKFLQAGVRCVFRRINPWSANACKGNSTITQQLARNLFLSEERSIERKLRELLWALKMEWGLSKEEILELYINRIFLGRGNFGIEMAARSYFGRSASDLNPREAAVLAAAIKRPAWNWEQDRAAAIERAQLILALMHRHGYIPKKVTLSENFRPRMSQRALHRPYLGHIWQWMRLDVAKVLRDLPDGDYKVLTSINAEVQVYAERRVAAEVEQLRRRGIPVSQGAVVVMRPNGEVLAMVGGLGDDVTGRGFNRARRTEGLLPRPPASSFKPLVYLAALEAGMTPGTQIDGGPVNIEIPGSKPYRPENHDGKTYGVLTLRDGLVRSINTAAVRLLHDHVGFDRLFDLSARVGIDASQFQRQWGLALGQSGVSLVEMVGAYGVFASRGRSVVPYAFLAVTTEGGKTVWTRPSPRRKQVVASRHVDELNRMLVDVVGAGTGTRARYKLPAELAVAGKTGTGDEFVDAWFIGFTDDIVIGTWIGNDRPISMNGVYGGTAPARAFNRILRDLIDHTDTFASRTWTP